MQEYNLPPNAFLEPDNPLAVFPQIKKPEIIDMRSHKIAGGAQAAIGVFRKHLSKNYKPSKYDAVIETAAMLEEKEAQAAAKMEEETDVIAV